MAQTSTTYRLTTTPTSIALTWPAQVIVSNTGTTKVLVGLGSPFTGAVAHPLPRYGDSIALVGTDMTEITVLTDETAGIEQNTKLASAVVTIIG